ncbi:MAG: hypothetical protein HOC71_04380 [Candidatus Latescibacteria bacterium]|nr:hypothetical protein [Candidatus Latescibacterota bacterium]
MIEFNEEIIDTRITDHWGVNWSPMEIARDFLQNFYDDNPINDISIDINDSTVTVSAPAQFDYNELLYLGSDKGEEKIGQYGEGFKAATLNALRNHNCGLHVIVDDKDLEFFLEDKKIGQRNKMVVMCRILKTDKFIGTKLLLTNCPQSLIDEFKFGLKHFYYENNPLFGELLAKTYEDDIFVYKSTTSEGCVFYKKLLRAKLDIPLVFVCNRTYKMIDAKIIYDRDRKAFNEEVLDKYLRLVCKPISHHVRDIVSYLEPWYKKGHKVLASIADSVRWNYSMNFPINYYAKHSKRKNISLEAQYEITLILDEFQEKSFIECPGYMAKLGMKTALSVFEKRKKQIEEKHHNLYTRKPEKLEREALNVLSDFIREIDPNLYDKFSNASYTIGESDEIIGELQKKRGFREKNIFLSTKVFTLEFSESLAILLHEWQHVYGHDGSRSFTDALTHLIAAIIRIKATDMLINAEKQWDSISSKIKKAQGNPEGASHLFLIIDRLSSDQKSKLLKNVPKNELIKFLEKEKLF